jgi:negative regulator of sigma E activity
MQQILEELRALADNRNIRDARKLYQLAKAQEMRGVTQALATEALSSSVARQILAPPTRSAGHFASSRPGQDIQADLIDFSKNTKLKGQPERYALVVADVFTRKLGIEPLKSKNAASVGAAMQRELKEMGVERPALIRTDQGKEFARLENEQNVHQMRDVRDTNGLAIVDRGIQSIKRDLAAEVGKKKGTKWADVAEKVVQDHNEQP